LAANLPATNSRRRLGWLGIPDISSPVRIRLAKRETTFSILENSIKSVPIPVTIGFTPYRNIQPAHKQINFPKQSNTVPVSVHHLSCTLFIVILIMNKDKI